MLKGTDFNEDLSNSWFSVTLIIWDEKLVPDLSLLLAVCIAFYCIISSAEQKRWLHGPAFLLFQTADYWVCLQLATSAALMCTGCLHIWINAPSLLYSLFGCNLKLCIRSLCLSLSPHTYYIVRCGFFFSISFFTLNGVWHYSGKLSAVVFGWSRYDHE